MKDYLVKRFLINQRLSLLEEKKRSYQKIIHRGEIIQRQISHFNKIWQHCYRTIPFYQQWQSKHDLPGRISSTTELQRFPLLTKRIIQDNQARIFQNGKIKRHISTGGSTGVPTRFPWSPEELTPNYADIYVGRSWHGIQPLDAMLLFWGHSHLFGTGLVGALNHYKRKVFDYVSNMRRLNAYDMTAETIENYFRIYCDSEPSFIVGYTSCIYKLGKYIDENKLPTSSKGQLKAVILTSETITDSDVQLLKKVFRVPIVIEYGMAETGVVAYSLETTWDIRILWDSFLATLGPEKTLCVTTLYTKCFPLINYDTEDRVVVGEKVEGSILQITAILGRKRDILRLGTIDGSYLELSGILMVHILKSYPHIFSIQFEQLKLTGVRIFLVADQRLNLGRVKTYFLREIRKDHKNIDEKSIDLVQVDRIPKTLAGKEEIVRPVENDGVPVVQEPQ